MIQIIPSPEHYENESVDTSQAFTYQFLQDLRLVLEGYISPYFRSFQFSFGDTILKSNELFVSTWFLPLFIYNANDLIKNHVTLFNEKHNTQWYIDLLLQENKNSILGLAPFFKTNLPFDYSIVVDTTTTHYIIYQEIVLLLSHYVLKNIPFTYKNNIIYIDDIFDEFNNHLTSLYFKREGDTIDTTNNTIISKELK